MPAIALTPVAAGNRLADQYNAIKASLSSGTILLLRVRDFYQIMGDDASRVARILRLNVLQHRGAPFCAVHPHQLDRCVRVLRAQGYRVATAVPRVD